MRRSDWDCTPRAPANAAIKRVCLGDDVGASVGCAAGKAELAVNLYLAAATRCNLIMRFASLVSVLLVICARSVSGTRALHVSNTHRPLVIR